MCIRDSALEAQIVANDGDISTLTTNLASTGSTLQNNLDTVESAAAASLVSTGNALEAQIVAKDGDISVLDSSTVRITGDQGIAGDKIFSDNVTINNLTVTGTRTIVESTDLAIEDNVIDINSGETGAGISKGTAGFNIARGTLSNATILFEEANDRFNLNFPVASEGDLLAKEADLIATGNNLETQITSSAAGNLTATGNALEAQIVANDGDISALDSSTVRITGDQGIAGDKIFSDNVTINNLTVTGTRTIVESTDLAIEDNVIDINSGETGAGISKGTAGFNIDRGTLSDATLLFEEANDRFNLNFPVASEGDLLAKEIDLIATGNNLETQISNTVAGNLTATGNALEAQIIANDGDISTLTTNLASTGSTLQSNLDTVESAAAASLVSTGNAPVSYTHLTLPTICSV